MNAEAEIKTRNRWVERAYRTIDRARFDEETRLLTVCFDDGTCVDFDPLPLLPDGLEELDLWRIASNSIEIIVPHGENWFEIPWDVIRRHTDPEFATHWERICIELNSEQQSGLRVLREDRPEFE